MDNNTPLDPLEKVYIEISSIIYEARNTVYRTANAEMVKAYWQIGRKIFEEEQNGNDRAAYGKEVVKKISKKLINRFGRGFTVTNLKYMRQFYYMFPKKPRTA